MPFRRLRVMARVAAGVLVFCVTATAIAARSEDALHAAVRKANGEWAAAMKTGDAAVIAAPYTDSAVFVLADGRSLQGRAAVERMYREGFQKGGPATSTTITSRSLVRDGDLAYESGYADVGVVRDGKPVTRGGRYLTVWQRQADGAWKILRNIVLP